MTQMWQMTKEMLVWLMTGESESDEDKCNCDCLDDDLDSEMDESILGKSVLIYMIIGGLFIGGYLVQNHLAQQCRSQRQREQQQQDRLIELTRSIDSNRNVSLRMPTVETLDSIQDVGSGSEEVSWLIHAQQHNLFLLHNDQKQLRQLQQQLMLSLSLQDVFHDLPTDDDDDSGENHFKDISDSSRLELIETPAQLQPVSINA